MPEEPWIQEARGIHVWQLYSIEYITVTTIYHDHRADSGLAMSTGSAFDLYSIGVQSLCNVHCTMVIQTSASFSFAVRPAYVGPASSSA